MFPEMNYRWPRGMWKAAQHHQSGKCKQKTPWDGSPFIPVRMATVKIWLEITSVGEDMEKREPLYTVGGNVNWCNHYEKQYGDFSKN